MNVMLVLHVILLLSAQTQKETTHVAVVKEQWEMEDNTVVSALAHKQQYQVWQIIIGQVEH